MMMSANRRGGVGHAGQAMVEMAIFGAVGIAALAFLMNVGMRLNYDQEIRMAAFRQALAAAHADNGTDQDAPGTVFHYILQRQAPNPGDGMMLLPRMRTEASAFVEWGDRFTFASEHSDNLPDNTGYKAQPLIVVRSDNQQVSYHQDDQLNDLVMGPMTFKAAEGIVNNSTTTATVNGTIRQSGAGSQLTSGGQTCTTTKLNTWDSGPPAIGSCVPTGAGAQPW